MALEGGVLTKQSDKMGTQCAYTLLPNSYTTQVNHVSNIQQLNLALIDH